MDRQQNLWQALRRGMNYDESGAVSEVELQREDFALSIEEIVAAKCSTRSDAARTSVASKLEEIGELNAALDAKYSDRLLVDSSLSRKLVSFQANKRVPLYRWYKYKEAIPQSWSAKSSPS